MAVSPHVISIVGRLRLKPNGILIKTTFENYGLPDAIVFYNLACRNEAAFADKHFTMNIVSPTWCLKTPRCECCSEQGALCFSTCPNCGYVILVCDEVGTVFPNPKNLTEAIYGAIDTPSYLCPNCKAVSLSEFRDSTSEEIQNLGFVAGEYE